MRHLAQQRCHRDQALGGLHLPHLLGVLQHRVHDGPHPVGKDESSEGSVRTSLRLEADVAWTTGQEWAAGIGSVKKGRFDLPALDNPTGWTWEPSYTHDTGS